METENEMNAEQTPEKHLQLQYHQLFFSFFLFKDWVSPCHTGTLDILKLTL